MRRRLLLILPGAMAVSAALMVVGPMTAAAAVTPGAPPSGFSGHDISWPQCGSAYPALGGFGIVGVTNGRAWSANPCLASEYQWAGGYPRTPDLYMNTANPAPSSSYYWPTSGAQDPALCQDATSTTDPGCAYDYGWHTAANALSTATSALGGPPQGIWWLDVETGNTWNGDASSNAADLQGSIELGVTLSPQSADAADPGRSAPQFLREVTRMGAIDHVVARIAPGRVVYLGNGDGKRLVPGQGSVGFDREGEDKGQSRPLCCAGDADGLWRVGQSLSVQ